MPGNRSTLQSEHFTNPGHPTSACSQEDRPPVPATMHTLPRLPLLCALQGVLLIPARSNICKKKKKIMICIAAILTL